MPRTRGPVTRQCGFSSSWGCFAEVAPDPRHVPGAPLRYRCVLSRGHRGNHVVEVAGHRYEREPLEVGRPPAEDPLDQAVQVRFRAAELAAIDRARGGQSRAGWLRRLALRWSGQESSLGE